MSMVLNDRPGSRVSADAARRYQEAAAALDYRPNPAAPEPAPRYHSNDQFISDG